VDQQDVALEHPQALAGVGRPEHDGEVVVEEVRLLEGVLVALEALGIDVELVTGADGELVHQVHAVVPPVDDRSRLLLGDHVLAEELAGRLAAAEVLGGDAGPLEHLGPELAHDGLADAVALADADAEAVVLVGEVPGERVGVGPGVRGQVAAAVAGAGPDEDGQREQEREGPPQHGGDPNPYGSCRSTSCSAPRCRFAALTTARSEAVRMLSSMPTPHRMSPSGFVVST
jgi:hypothetical protein